jgi:hypothetical protein
MAPVWRPHSASEVADDPMVRARAAVAEAHQRVAAQLAEQGRAQRVAGWHAEIQAADHFVGPAWSVTHGHTDEVQGAGQSREEVGGEFVAS